MQENDDLRYFLNKHQKFDVRSVLVLLHHDEVFARMEMTPEKKLYILPGGAVKFNEESQTTAQREAHEELGLSGLKLEFAGVLENFWNFKGADYHQINLVYRQEVNQQIYQQLQHLDYQKLDLPAHVKLIWVNVSQIQKSLQPTGLINMCHNKVPIQHLVNHQSFGF